MLKIFNQLEPFFEDCYREFGVREYAKIAKISPPSASKILKEFAKEGFFLKREYRNNILFRVNRESKVLKDLSRIYWQKKLSHLIEFIEDSLTPSLIVLFGSLSKLEVTKDSDIDLFVIGLKRDIQLEKFEKMFGREIQIFQYSSLSEVNKNLKLNILNGFILYGYI